MANPTIDGVEVAAQADLVALEARVAKLEAAPVVAGVPGPVGPKGDTGPAGPQGPAGAAGTASVDDFLAALKTLLLGGAASPVSSGGVTPAPVAPVAPSGPQSTDPNAWPMDMSAIADKTAATWSFGTGPDSFELRLADNPNAAFSSCFNLIYGEGTPHQRELLKNITLTSRQGMGTAGDNHIVVNGYFGTNPSFSQTGAGDAGLNDVFVNSILYNGSQWYDQSPPGVNSRGTDADFDQTSLYNSGHSQHLVYGPWVQPTTIAATTATSTLINGQDLKTLLAAATTYTVLPAGTIVGTGKLNVGLSLRGATQDTTIITGLGITPDEDKAVIVVQKGSKVTDLTAAGGYVNAALGFNAAGIRNETPDPIDVERVTLRGNQNGILTDAATDGVSTLTDINLDGNGAVNPDGSTPGNTHQMYLGGLPSATYNGQRIKTITPCRDAHEIKCRAGTSTWTDSDMIGGNNGSAYDFSNGGLHTITGGSIAKVAGAADTVMIGFGMENANNASIGSTLTISGAVFKTGGLILCNGNNPNAKLVLTNVTYLTDKPDFSAFKNVTGDITKAA